MWQPGQPIQFGQPTSSLGGSDGANAQPICPFFQKGHCKFENRCKMSHAIGTGVGNAPQSSGPNPRKVQELNKAFTDLLANVNQAKALTPFQAFQSNTISDLASYLKAWITSFTEVLKFSPVEMVAESQWNNNQYALTLDEALRAWWAQISKNERMPRDLDDAVLALAIVQHEIIRKLPNQEWAVTRYKGNRSEKHGNKFLKKGKHNKDKRGNHGGNNGNNRGNWSNHGGNHGGNRDHNGGGGGHKNGHGGGNGRGGHQHNNTNGSHRGGRGSRGSGRVRRY
jgi:hypothetical protein